MNINLINHNWLHSIDCTQF